MGSPIPLTPQGNMPAIGIPNSQDYARLIFAAPYFDQIPIAEIIQPSVTEAVENILPSLVPQYVDAAVLAGVQQYSVLLTGSTMSGPLFLNPLMPTADAQAATKAYVDTMLATAGIPEVPPVPVGQIWGRETGQWTPISQAGGTFLPIAGGSMQGNINMSGNTITNLASVPAMPNGAAPAQWVLNNIAAVSLYQGTWDADTNTPDLTQLSTHVNAWTWIAITTSVSGVVIGAAIPGLQGLTVFNGDTIIYSTAQGAFSSIHAGGISLPEADGRYVQLAGSQMSGALLLNANASQPLQATTLQQLDAAVANTVTPDAPADGQAYLRVGVGTTRWVPGLPLAGGILTGALTLSGPGASGNNAVTVAQMNSAISGVGAGFLPIAGGTMTGALVLNGNATANLNAVPLQQLNATLNTYAPLQNPAFSGTPTAPTATPSTANTQQVANTAFVQSALGGALAGYLPLTGGTLSGPLQATGFETPLNSGLAMNQNASGQVIATGVSGTVGTGGSGLSINAFASSAAGAAPTAGATVIGIGTGTGNYNFLANTVTPGQVTLDLSGQNGNTASLIQMPTGSQIASTSTYFGIGLSGAWNAANAWRITWGRSDAQLQYFNNVGTVLWRIDGTGNMAIAGTLSQGSDARSKDNIAEWEGHGLDIVAGLVPKTFVYKEDETQLEHLGFIAQEVMGVLPHAVRGSEETSFGLDTTPIIAALVGAVKELSTRTAALEAR